MATDDYTTLNPGTGGDAMDETAVTYGTAPTTRKRARVQIGGSTAASLVEPVAADPGVGAYASPAIAVGVVSDAPTAYNDGDLRSVSLTTDGRLRVATAPGRFSENTLDEEQASMWGAAHLGGPASPWEGW